MAEVPDIMGHIGGLAQPLHIQRLHKSLVLQPFLNSVEKVFKHAQSDDSDSDVDVNACNVEKKGEKVVNGIPTTKEERRSDKMRLFNFTNIQSDRKWLRDVLISDTSGSSDDEDKSITDEYFQEMLKQHVQEKKFRKQVHLKSNYHQYQYYGTGLLSNYDKYPEHQKTVIGFKKVESSKPRKRLEKNSFESTKGRKSKKGIKKDTGLENLDHDEIENEEKLGALDEFEDEHERLKPVSGQGKGSRGKKRADKQKSPEVMAMRRRKLWAVMSKKELAKGQRSKANNHKEVTTMCKKVAQLCIKHWKQKALQSQKNMKETVWRNKRLTREMQAYWKRYERVERDTRRRQEKEAEEQRKMDVELMEAKRQQRKLNFLITQTELYAHFISKKLCGSNFNEQHRILSQLDEEKNPRLATIDDYNSEEMKARATKNVEEAFNAEKVRSSQFENASVKKTESGQFNDERPQPLMFKGNLKHYQLKGMNWLSNLYDQGINGILADEMGLGKTVQSIAFLCHIAEKYSVWGPFLIISPASTLHNWQQEMERFVPDFKVVPYWGSVQERRILRQFWDQKDLHTKEASFHVVITSYQLVITDFKYFNRIKWQYLILDEAQAIKSSNSMRWKLLLGFSCRNRLLLSGTPIQNSMAELWALLHFIMPTLFDNHEEFSEWFSKDIESQAENKSKIDEKHLSRLHLILKPFMLRRIKKDVENELSDKIEVMVYCPLTIRQKLLYSGLKKKIRIEDLLAGISGRGGTTGEESGNKNVASSLMNLVMQFRKVCNHPELFERREARSPLYFICSDYIIPKLVFEEGILNKAIPSVGHLLYNKLSILAIEWIHRSLFPAENGDEISMKCDSFFSFLRFVGFSPQELRNVLLNGILFFWLYSYRSHRSEELIFYRNMWNSRKLSQNRLLISPESRTSFCSIATSPVLNQIVFTSYVGSRSTVYTHTKHIHHSMAETLQHRVLRSQKLKLRQTELKSEGETVEPESPMWSNDGKGNKKLCKSPTKTAQKNVGPSEESKIFVVPEFPFVKRPPRVFECVPTEMPEFLYVPNLKVQAKSRVQYSSCRNSAWNWTKHLLCSNAEGWEIVWYGHSTLAEQYRDKNSKFHYVPVGGLTAAEPNVGWSNITIPDKQTMVADAGKLYVLDGLLKRLKEGGHRVLIYSQMTRMIDLLEEYMWHRKHTYMRLDGSSKISERRDMVADFQSRADIFVFLLSTRAGGLGINLTAADTVIFYDSDWNPTVDQQAMDRAHRLGQTKQVTVYRLICKGTIEERILQRAREKSEIQRMVISGGHFKPDHLKPKEVVSLLLDDEEIEKKYHQKQAEKKLAEENKQETQKTDKRRKLKTEMPANNEPGGKKVKLEPAEETVLSVDSTPQSPTRSDYSMGSGAVPQDDTSNDCLVVDVDSPAGLSSGLGLSNNPYNPLGIGSLRVKPVTRGSRRGRPRGLRRGAFNSVSKKYTGGIKLPGEMFLSGESPTVDVVTPSKRGRGLGGTVSTGFKRGPGRPRMRPFTPGSRGTRGPSRARKAAGPLQVPISRTSASSSPASGSGPGTARPYGFYTPCSSGPE
ncbi:hypothetical protein RUM43_010648 [Polyplax serrata]|uniref:Chromatin-remodeling ATPase INO80 n=1 Tax=Polyplax serrata TaxID=468196 RepID=A0AAN8PKT9_POLSC